MASMTFEIERARDKNMWELWMGNCLFAVVHDDFFSIDILDELVTHFEQETKPMAFELRVKM